MIPYGCDCNNLAPHVGFAYRLPGVWGMMRAAYGLQYGDIFPVTYSAGTVHAAGDYKW